MKYLCLAREEEQKLNNLSKGEWQILRQEALEYVKALRTSGHLPDADGRAVRGNKEPVGGFIPDRGK